MALPAQKPIRTTSKIKNKCFIPQGLRNREIGLQNVYTDDDWTYTFYNSFDKVNSCDYAPKFGGIFNLEFSLDGRMLVGACEEKGILFFDATNQKLVKTISNAHLNCVNCVRFLNDVTFASCSDDASIKLWDIRNLGGAARTLYGHSNWVKSIEYSEAENMMVTSAFDGSIYAWNLRDFPENNRPYDKVFIMSGMMRTKLTPDGTKMVISTTSGYMIIIHELNLLTLANDLKSFKPLLYRLMQSSEQNFPAGNIYNCLFHPSRRRNRVEFIDDFPNNAEVITSLQIHPHGWNAVSRNINEKKTEDWTSVHDIQTRPPSDYTDFLYIDEESTHTLSNDNPNNIRPTDLWLGYISNEQYSRSPQGGDQGADNWELPAMSTLNSGLIGHNIYDTCLSRQPDHKNKIVSNLPRLTHFIKEKSVAKGVIKEMCYSADGRIICSPYGKGIRLLGFNDYAQELSHCLSDHPKQLTPIVELKNYHKNVVLCCKFNPKHMQLVTGCLGGEILWYQPVL